MARVTVEDCLRRVSSPFDLVVAATQRVRELSSGAEPTLPLENDKLTVLALREIVEGTVDHLTLLRSVCRKKPPVADGEEGGEKERADPPEENSDVPPQPPPRLDALFEMDGETPGEEGMVGFEVVGLKSAPDPMDDDQDRFLCRISDEALDSLDEW